VTDAEHRLLWVELIRILVYTAAWFRYCVFVLYGLGLGMVRADEFSFYQFLWYTSILVLIEANANQAYVCATPYVQKTRIICSLSTLK
jgi:hypothetical protein